MFRNDALAGQGGRCAYCHEPMRAAAATADHVEPRKRGGTTRRENISAACKPCNLTKGHLSKAAFLAKIKSPEPADGIHVWLAHFRRRLWLSTHRACKRIARAAA